MLSISRFLFIKIALAATAIAMVSQPSTGRAQETRPNLLIITVDDMSADSVGKFNCKLPNTTPHIDRLASEGLRFNKAHVVVGNCFPSRNVMWSGLYPHNNGAEGFYQVRDAKHPHLADLMQQAGYFTAIQHKVNHSTPYHPYPAWDVNLDIDPQGKKRDIKSAKSYYEGVRQGIAQAKDAEKPFCLLINVSDPHKPFYAQGKGGKTIPDKNKPTQVFSPSEVPIPGFLFDDPVVRKELSHYYSSVRRADDCVGATLKALDESGQRENTIIVFLSDHGMPLPFAKTQVYHHSTHTPLIFVVPGVTTADSVDNQHFVSAVDLLPTLLDLLEIQCDNQFDGKSFAALVRGESQLGRDAIFKEYNENSGASRDPMRAVQTESYLYIFNPWSNGERVMATATTGTTTYRRMAELAKSDATLASRLDLYKYRVLEELYDVSKDPDCLKNLIDSPDHAENVKELQSRLESWMETTHDPMLEAFRNRSDAEAVEAFVAKQELEAELRKRQK